MVRRVERSKNGLGAHIRKLGRPCSTVYIHLPPFFHTVIITTSTIRVGVCVGRLTFIRRRRQCVQAEALVGYLLMITCGEEGRRRQQIEVNTS